MVNGERPSRKQQLEESIRKFIQSYEQIHFNWERQHLHSKFFGHFQEIRFQIDEHREKLKEKHWWHRFGDDRQNKEIRSNVFEQSPKTKHCEPSSFDKTKKHLKIQLEWNSRNIISFGWELSFSKKKKSFLTFYFNLTFLLNTRRHQS